MGNGAEPKELAAPEPPTDGADVVPFPPLPTTTEYVPAVTGAAVTYFIAPAPPPPTPLPLCPPDPPV
jgi:hypothetical protein